MASVWPTISGTTVDRRDQVLMTLFSPPRFIVSIFSSSGVSTKGPFLSDLLIAHPCSGQCAVRSVQRATPGDVPSPACPLSAAHGPLHVSLWPPLNDEPVGGLPVPRLVALGRHAPRRHRVPSARGLALTAAERVIDGVHSHAAHVRPLAQPPAAPGLAVRDVLVV